ncbi:MAG: hypothetical protein Q9219_002329 [cf. Caloplaca sp. 3 TL-2023]
MTKFRPCIDLHSGHVKQIVGGTLSETDSDLRTNFISKLPASYFANLYKKHSLHGAHVIMLGPGNEAAAQEALEAWPGQMQLGGGITADNAMLWVERGAEKPFCSEFLIHAADNEGLQQGIDQELVSMLGKWCTKPVTYAGGGRHLEDLDLVRELKDPPNGPAVAGSVFAAVIVYVVGLLFPFALLLWGFPKGLKDFKQVDRYTDKGTG